MSSLGGTSSILVLALLSSLTVSANSDAPVKGALPEIGLQANDEDKNQTKALSAEVLITKTEQEATNSLKKIIEKRKGSPEEPSLWYRMAELEMRRAKSGRFFDLFRDNEKLQKATRFVAPQIKEQTAAAHLRESVKIYDRIEKQWPKFEDMDAVLFNNAFANQQLGSNNVAEAHYKRLATEFTNSPLLPDAELALGEMAYDRQAFGQALVHFQKVEKYPDNRVYAYGMYKTAWTLYNMQQSDAAMAKLEQVAQYFSTKNVAKARTHHNLRTEALRDLALFYEETRASEKALAYFEKVCEESELEEQLIALGKLYDSHSRYKDLAALTDSVVLKAGTRAARLTLEVMLTESLELEKKRPEVLNHLVALQQACIKPDEKLRSICQTEVTKVTTEMAKKWWELWQKNKDHKEVADWTLRAFDLLLASEDPAKPDVRTRYADAELLFQLGRFGEASVQYEKVSNITQDTQTIHDASYASLVSGEKANLVPTEILRLSQNYLTKNPTGEHAFEVQFKIGFIEYTNKDNAKALLMFQPLAQNKKAGALKRKSEDLMLDIFNAEKNYAGLIQWTKTFLSEKPEPARAEHLRRLQEEAEYADLQARLEKEPDGPKSLRQFAADHPTSDLSVKALWQAISIDNAKGNVIEAADQCLSYAQKYPQDEKSLQCLQTAAASYADQGFLNDAAQTLLILAGKAKDPSVHDKNINLAADAFELDGQVARARELLLPMTEVKDPAKAEQMAAKVLALTQSPADEALIKNLKERFAKQGLEPYASLKKVAVSESFLKEEKWTEAFKSTKDLISGDVPSEAKARANLVRAQVYEHELVSQSTKTSVERLETVLAIKTEKLEKAQVAYNLVGKLSNDKDVKMAALQGLLRCYNNFVDAVTHPQLKGELAEADKALLDKELTKLAKPMVDHVNELQEKIKAATKVAEAPKDTHKPASVAAEATARALPVTLTPAKGEKAEKFSLRKSDKCPATFDEKKNENVLDGLTSAANRCLALGAIDQAEAWAKKMARMSPQTIHGLFYLALVADERSQKAKAQYLLSLATKKDPHNPVLASFGGGQ